jgi:hypothetical protein
MDGSLYCTVLYCSKVSILGIPDTVVVRYCTAWSGVVAFFSSVSGEKGVWRLRLGRAGLEGD